MRNKTFRYRIYPTPSQERKLRETLDECRWLYNQLLQERRNIYKKSGKSTSLHAQINRIPELKRERKSLGAVHSQVLQNVAARVDLTFKAFFRRIEPVQKPGYPRFRGAGRYGSFTYPQSGFKVEKIGGLSNGGKVFLSKIGHVKATVHRPLEGKVKTCTVRRVATGKWFVCFSCEVAPELLPESGEKAGVDVGLESFVVLSNGEKIENPRFFRAEEKALAKAQRRLSKIEERGTSEYEKRRKVVAKVNERIANKRRNFAHRQSRHLVNRFGSLVVEDLSINRMNKNRRLAKSVMDAAWFDFAQKLSYKAEWAGREFVRVNPAYTSQDCSRCGHQKAMPLSERMCRCEMCGLELDRDHNAALNILTLGLQSRGLAASRSLHSNRRSSHKITAVLHEGTARDLG